MFDFADLLLNISHLEIRGDFQGELALVSRDSKECDEHTVFAAIRGEKNDGHDFVPNAYAHGTRVFIVEKKCNLPRDCTQIIVENSRKALAEAALFFAGHPEKKMRFVAVTGTKGKSTTAAMIYKILSYSGIDACLIGTNGLKYKNLEYNTENSTPDITVTARFLGKTAAHGCKIAVIEASSQGIKQNRLFGLDFNIGVMTNLSADHIGKGEHPDFEDYKNSKMKLFESCKTAIFNADDERCAELCGHENHKTFGIFSPSDVHADNIFEVRFANGFGVKFDVSCGGATTKCRIPMPYNFTVYNSLAAISACTHFGVPLDVCAAALEDFSLEGRFEKVASDAPFDIVIDYAHNGESLKNALLAARKFCAGKLICVFGSVGERTEMRRKALGEAANANADICVITSDNPNFEDPVKIAHEIAALVTDKPYKIIADRKEAIEYAVSIAERGDFVLLAGKGHEKYQLVRGEKVPFDERQIIKEATKTKIQI